jgi:hypothetical protein
MRMKYAKTKGDCAVERHTRIRKGSELVYWNLNDYKSHER